MFFEYSITFFFRKNKDSEEMELASKKNADMVLGMQYRVNIK